MHAYHAYNKLSNRLGGTSVTWKSPALKQLDPERPETGGSVVNDPPLASAEADTAGLVDATTYFGHPSSHSSSRSNSSTRCSHAALQRSAGPAPGETPECPCVACSGTESHRRHSEPHQVESQVKTFQLQPLQSLQPLQPLPPLQPLQTPQPLQPSQPPQALQPLQPLQWQQQEQHNQHDHREQEHQLQLLQTKLAPWGLAQYAHALEQRGYDAEVLSMLHTGEVEELLGLIACKPGHRVRFRRFFEKCKK